jgi:hypothetical protein
MVYPVSAQYPAVVVSVDPALQSRLLANATDLEQVLQRLDQVGGVGQRVAVNMLTVAPVAGPVGVWAPLVNVLLPLCAAYGNDASNADLDEFSVDVYIPTTGQWRLTIAAPQDLDTAIVQLFIDGAQIGLVAGYDLYAAAPDVDSYIGISGLQLTAGLHRLRLLCNGRNIASANNIARVTQIEFLRTA